jgi:hypothetical protein
MTNLGGRKISFGLVSESVHARVRAGRQISLPASLADPASR